jgi:hypothetical protein
VNSYDLQDLPYRRNYCSFPAGDLLCGESMEDHMNTIKLAVLAAGLLTSLPVLAQTAGGTQNTGPQGTGNFVAGQTNREGTPVVGKPEGTGNPVAGQPADKMDKMDKMDKK